MERQRVSPVLLDTHALVWLVIQSARFGARARRLIEKAQADDRLYFSAISFWEIAMLAQAGKLRLRSTPERWRGEILGLGLQETALDGGIAIRAAGLLDFHRDPADRFIAATALEMEATLVTADNVLLEWRIKVKRQDARL